MNRLAVEFYYNDKSHLLLQILQWVNNFKFAAYLNSNNFPDVYGGQYDALIAVADTGLPFNNNSNRFSQLENYYDLKDWLFGYLSYDLKNDVEQLVSSKPDYLDLPEIFFFRPEYVFELKENKLIIHSFLDDHHKIFKTVTSINTAGKEEVIPKANLYYRTPKDVYLRNAGLIKNHIIEGDFYELNYCQQLFCEDVKANAATLYEKLASLSPSPFSAFIKVGEQYVISTSPERFLAKKNNRLISQPIKGTRKRILSNKAEDERLIEELLGSEKERAENLMIVDLVRNDLSRSAKTGSVKTEELCVVHSFPQVHQMISTISSILEPNIHPIQAIKYAFPMGSMTGAPKIEVMKTIEHYEDVKRGVYSGAIGYINPAGDFDFNVVIRSIIYDAFSHLLSYHVGSAITYDAIAEEEYEECLLKALAFRQLIGDV